MRKLALLAAASLALASLPAPIFADTSVLQASATLTGLGYARVSNLTNQSTCTTTVSGGGTKTITFEGAGNGQSTGNVFNAAPDTGTYTGINTTTFTGGTPATTATADGLYVTQVPALSGFQARVSSYSSGTVKLVVTCAAGLYANTSVTVTGGSGSSATPVPSQTGANGAINTNNLTQPSPGPTDANSVPFVHPTGLAPTPAPGPTDANQVPLVHPTGVAAPQVLPTGANGAPNFNDLSQPSPGPTGANGFPNTNALNPSLTQPSVSLSTACATPTTPTACAATSYAIFNLGPGGSAYSYQINAINGGTVAFVAGNDGSNFFPSNLTIAGGTYNTLSVANS